MTKKKARKFIKKAERFAFKKASKIQKEALEKGVAITELAVRYDKYGEREVAEVFSFNPDFGGNWGSPDSYSREMGGFYDLKGTLFKCHVERIPVKKNIR